MSEFNLMNATELITELKTFLATCDSLGHTELLKAFYPGK